jgi:dihydrofolate synthase/folylpolyglutamate synthase
VVKAFTGSEEVYGWISAFINLERGIGGSPREHFKLDRMAALAKIAAHPEACAPVIHLAGSKGKGSAAAMISAILSEAGIKTVRYLSPHVSCWKERIGSAGGFLEERVYVDAGNELLSVYNEFKRTGRRTGIKEPTFFELFTLYFFLCARAWDAKMMVVETGIGGRLDATNIVEPLGSVITRIEMEHTGYLGGTLEAIAREKAGIIKRGRPVFCAVQEKAALSPLRKKAASLDAPFYRVDDHAQVKNICVHFDRTEFTLLLNNVCGDYSLPVAGKVYADNAALAVLTITTLFPDMISGEIIKNGLEACALPCRFEQLAADPQAPAIVADGAHTPESAALCARTFCGLYGEEALLLFACSRDKNAAAMAKILAARFSRIVITSTGNSRAFDPKALYSLFLSAGKASPLPAGVKSIELIPDTAEAVKHALDLRARTRKPLLGTGSFYLAAALRNALS